MIDWINQIESPDRLDGLGKLRQREKMDKLKKIDRCMYQSKDNQADRWIDTRHMWINGPMHKMMYGSMHTRKQR